MTVQAINSDTADIPSVNMAQQGSDIAAPAAGRWQLYFKAGGLYARSNAGGVIGPFLVTAPDALIIAEIDGAPSGQPTTLQFPNGTVTDQGGGVYRYTPTGPATGGTPVLLLDYVQAADLSQALTSGSWVDVLANQSFTVAAATSLVEFALRGVSFTNQGGQYGVRLVIDSAGTPVYVQLGGAYKASNIVDNNLFAGCAPVYVDGLSAAAHTVKIQVSSNTVGTTWYCRPTSQPDCEYLGLQVIEHP